MSHLGSRVSALVDGRLSPEEEERCWNHVHSCHTCRDLVEHEGWVKTQLAQLSLGPSEPSHDFKSALVGRCSSLTPASGSSLAPAAFRTAHHRPRRSLVAIGGGAASACVVGVLALGVAGSPRVEPRPPATDLSRPAGSSTPATVVDGRTASGPVSPSRTPLAERLVAIREKIVQ
jgi:anti-sigma factor RsiW